MFQKLIAMFVFLFLVSTIEASPCFEDYAVEVYTGAVTKPEKNADNVSVFGAQLEAAERGVNFAGKYVLFRYSCGGGCISGGVLDATTGKLVTDFPDEFVAGDEPETFRLNFRKDSRLILIEGASAYDGQLVREYYEMLDGKLKVIKD